MRDLRDNLPIETLQENAHNGCITAYKKSPDLLDFLSIYGDIRRDLCILVYRQQSRES